MMMLVMLMAATATVAPPPSTRTPVPAGQECRRQGSPNGASVGRKICKWPAEWAAYDREHAVLTFGLVAGASTVGDGDNRTMARAPTVR